MESNQIIPLYQLHPNVWFSIYSSRIINLCNIITSKTKHHFSFPKESFFPFFLFFWRNIRNGRSLASCPCCPSETEMRFEDALAAAGREDDFSDIGDCRFPVGRVISPPRAWRCGPHAPLPQCREHRQVPRQVRSSARRT